jgi:tetratricopeptide (TPR) repeat protein
MAFMREQIIASCAMPVALMALLGMTVAGAAAQNSPAPSAPSGAPAQSAESMLSAGEQNRERCTAHSPVVRIAGCTAVIESGQTKPRDMVTALFNRGMALRSRKEYQRAVDDFTGAIALMPGEPVVYYERANTYRFLHQEERALQDYSEAIKLAPDYWEALGDRGITLVALGRYPQAVADLTRVIEYDPAGSYAYSDRAVAYESMGLDELAIADLTTSFKTQPDAWMRYAHRGNIYFRKREYERALADYDQALMFNPAYGLALYGRGIVKRLTGDAGGGDDDIAKATALQPDVADEMARYGVKP